MQITARRSDIDLKNDVLAELLFEPSIKCNDIGVVVQDGAVTLNGYATSLWEKWNAVAAVKRVAGVVALADDIEVKLIGSPSYTDGDIAAAAIHGLNWLSDVPEGAVTVTVRDARLTLEGTVDWWFQRQDAEAAAHRLAGVKSVHNLIAVRPKLCSEGVKSAIEAAFCRNALLDANKIEVEVDDGKVVLRGKARNYAEREEAVRVSWCAPGVSDVINHVSVDWF